MSSKTTKETIHDKNYESNLTPFFRVRRQVRIRFRRKSDGIRYYVPQRSLLSFQTYVTQLIIVYHRPRMYYSALGYPKDYPKDSLAWKYNCKSVINIVKNVRRLDILYLPAFHVTYRCIYFDRLLLDDLKSNFNDRTDQGHALSSSEKRHLTRVFERHFLD